MTPYLILDDDMVTALTYAAKRGVDTVIVMPHIPDNEIRLYAGPFLLSGVNGGRSEDL